MALPARAADLSDERDQLVIVSAGAAGAAPAERGSQSVRVQVLM